MGGWAHSCAIILFRGKSPKREGSTYSSPLETLWQKIMGGDLSPSTRRRSKFKESLYVLACCFFRKIPRCTMVLFQESLDYIWTRLWLWACSRLIQLVWLFIYGNFERDIIKWVRFYGACGTILIFRFVNNGSGGVCIFVFANWSSHLKKISGHFRKINNECVWGKIQKVETA